MPNICQVNGMMISTAILTPPSSSQMSQMSFAKVQMKTIFSGMTKPMLIRLIRLSVEFETLLDVAERVQCGRRQALAVGRRGGTEGGRGRDSVEHEGVIILPLNPLIAIALSWFL